LSGLEREPHSRGACLPAGRKKKLGEGECVHMMNEVPKEENFKDPLTRGALSYMAGQETNG